MAEVYGGDAVGGGLAQAHDLGGWAVTKTDAVDRDQAPSAPAHFGRAAAEVGAEGRAGGGDGATG